jgi:hypothetical protein
LEPNSDCQFGSKPLGKVLGGEHWDEGADVEARVHYAHFLGTPWDLQIGLIE